MKTVIVKSRVYHREVETLPTKRVEKVTIFIFIFAISFALFTCYTFTTMEPIVSETGGTFEGIKPKMRVYSMYKPQNNFRRSTLLYGISNRTSNQSRISVNLVPPHSVVYEKVVPHLRHISVIHTVSDYEKVETKLNRVFVEYKDEITATILDYYYHIIEREYIDNRGCSTDLEVTINANGYVIRIDNKQSKRESDLDEMLSDIIGEINFGDLSRNNVVCNFKIVYEFI